MNQSTGWFTFGMVYITFWVTVAYTQVGEVSTCSVETNTWVLPVGILCVLGLPFVLGYWAGESKE